MTVITISTVGYSELHDMTEAGRMFSVLLILVSFGSLAYCGSLIFGFILEGGIVTFTVSYTHLTLPPILRV